MKLIIPIFVSMMILFSCRPEAQTSARRIVYDAGDQQVISHAVNKKSATMSILYGNAAAYNAALAGNGTHQPGAQYTLVTWQYHENPLFYGSNINGELLSVEKLAVKPGKTDYQVESGKVLPVNGVLLDTEKRKNYILGYRPSIMP
ncbi:hypothetical protein [uncultured Chitinophaga sp.]|uniref:hypothetical protein n=1 Tax=uncultured Chitinophaga sp. TaxID=339340 RepID=UPI0025E307E5|nr:hypothetical protein [uncultured Chitinophaga sp.]